MIGLIFRVLRVADGYRGRIRLAAVLSFLKSLCSKAPFFAAYFMIAGFLDKTITEKTCLILGLILVLSVILQSFLQNAADHLQSTAGFEIFADKRRQLGAHLRRLPMGYFTEGNIGKISSILSTDMLFIEENLMMVLADLMSYLFSSAIFVAIMFAFNVWMGVLSLLITVIMYVLGEAMKASQLRFSGDRQQASQKLTESVLDFAEGIGIIKTYNLLGEKSKALTESFEYSCEKNLEFEKGHAPWACAINLTFGLGSTAMLALACFLYNFGKLDSIMLIGFMLFTFELFGPIKAFYSQITRLTVMSACLDRIEAVFDEKELDNSGHETLPKTSEAPEIEFKNVSFSYDGNREVLHDITFAVEKNTMTALVGPSGGGKSTIASLLPRFWDVKSGSVFLRGKDITKIPISELMGNISMVFQRVYLFQDTVYNNIAMGRIDASCEEVYEAAKKARCYDFIMQLPQGFQTVIGEGGESLSNGEKQRISIARCILKDAPIVILDEATASVDADNERQIQEAINQLVYGKTLLVIAHRLNTIKKANQILVVNDGKIAECGSHQDLLKKKGIYYNMLMKRNSTTGFCD